MAPDTTEIDGGGTIPEPLRRMISEGAPAKAVAEELGITIPDVYKRLREHLPRIQADLREIRDAQVIEAYRDRTILVHEVARTFTISQGTVYAILRRHGVQLRQEADVRDDSARIVQLYLAGTKLHTICTDTRRSVQYIYKTLREAGVQLRRSM